MIIPIAPVPCFPHQAVSLRVDDGHVTLDVGADFQWALLDASSAVVAGPGRQALSPDQYAQWAGSDREVAVSIALNLGLTPA
jgi:hypothetical protein